MRQIAPLLFGFLLLLLSLNQEVTSQPKCDTAKNLGCSVPGKLPFFYKKTFTPACVKHDVCYYCGQRWEWTRKQCDKTFKQDMDALCDRVSRRKRWFFFNHNKAKCKRFSFLYYGAVFAAGSHYWAERSPAWCEQSCAKDQGNPKRSLTGK